MKIDGTKIASRIYDELKIKVKKLKEQGIVPQIAVILIGNDPASVSYISQKRKWSKNIGVKFSLYKYPSAIKNEEILEIIQKLNNDYKIHGIIIQRPVPPQIDKSQIIDALKPEKDVDGFAIDSPYDPPVAKAILSVLEVIYNSKDVSYEAVNIDFKDWLKNKTITVLGKGETAGGPIIKLLTKTGLNPKVITSSTVNPEKILLNADIIISAVGKENIIQPEYIKKNAVLLGVGLFKGQDKKLHGDYDVSKIKNKAAFYTPVLGGIGPVNVAYLLSNLVAAAAYKLTFDKK